MYIVRPIKRGDLDQLYALAKLAKAGLTTLPTDKKLLKARINESIKGFSKKVKTPRGETYFFVMEDTKAKKLVGTCAIISKVGVREPFYTYEIKKAYSESKTLKVKRVIQYLKLKIIRNGPSEIGTLFLIPSAREKNGGRLLALSRYLFMAQYRGRFTDKVFAELRGVIDENDHSPFWNAVCRHFFKVAFKKADLMVMQDKSFIAELIPKHPIYIPILPESVQKIIGGVHQSTVPALKLLQQEGFDYVPEIDIFEAGPTLSAKINNIRTVKKSKTAKVMAIVDSIELGENYLIANVTTLNAFKVTHDNIRIHTNGVTITKAAAQAIRIKIGQKVRFVKARG
jgi:arginine N-succinyltransferase